MQTDLEVDVEGLRGCAVRLSASADDVATGVAHVPSLPVSTPGWATVAASTALCLAAERELATLAEAGRRASRVLRDTVDGYLAADARAAARLRGAS